MAPDSRCDCAIGSTRMPTLWVRAWRQVRKGQKVRYLFRDFKNQSWFMKAVIGWGWLCVLIMVASLIDNLRIITGA